MEGDTKLVVIADGSGSPPVEVPLTPEEQEQRADDAAGHARTQATAVFAANEDAERLRTINERARTDPAYAALADIVLKGMSR